MIVCGECRRPYSGHESAEHQTIDALRARLAGMEAARERLEQGITQAHYHLASSPDEYGVEADTDWLMYFLDGLLAGQSSDQAAEYARVRRQQQPDAAGAE